MSSSRAVQVFLRARKSPAAGWRVYAASARLEWGGDKNEKVDRGADHTCQCTSNARVYCLTACRQQPVFPECHLGVFQIEWHSCRVQVPVNIWELGLRHFLQEPDYVLAYADFLTGQLLFSHLASCMVAVMPDLIFSA